MNLSNFNRYFKLYLKCILKNKNYAFIENLSQQSFKNENILLDAKHLYFMVLHLKFSSLMYSAQLTDIFSYEVPRGNFTTLNNTTNLNKNNFKYSTPSNLNLLTSTKVVSITELFFAANWLEREVSELSGIVIKDKKDLRNLMLQYGDSSAPFQKSFPSIGLKEMYYNPIKDTIIQNPVSVQI